MDIQVSDVTTRGDRVIVTFSDACMATFDAYAHGFGYGVEGMRSFRLERSGEPICTFNGRLYRSGPRADEGVITYLDPAYSQQQIAVYWVAARQWLDQYYFKNPLQMNVDHLWYPWMLVCCESGMYCRWFEEGTAKTSDNANADR